jgi:hypothetical protein
MRDLFESSRAPEEVGVGAILFFVIFTVVVSLPCPTDQSSFAKSFPELQRSDGRGSIESLRLYDGGRIPGEGTRASEVCVLDELFVNLQSLSA